MLRNEWEVWGFLGTKDSRFGEFGSRVNKPEQSNVMTRVVFFLCHLFKTKGTFARASRRQANTQTLTNHKTCTCICDSEPFSKRKSCPASSKIMQCNARVPHKKDDYAMLCYANTVNNNANNNRLLSTFIFQARLQHLCCWYASGSDGKIYRLH